MSLTAKSCASYVKKNTKNYDPTKIKFFRVGSTLHVLVLDSGSIREVPMYPTHENLDRNMGKFQDIFDGLPWDTKLYFKPYYTVSMPNPNPAMASYPKLVETFYNDMVIVGSDALRVVDKIRKFIPGCGIKDVGRPTISVTVDEWIERTLKETPNAPTL